MALLPLADVAPLLVCPRCRCLAVQEEEGFRCSSDSCVFNAPRSFPLVGRWPALADFERSILEPAELLGSATSGVNRWSIDLLPRQGATLPWRLNQNWFRDVRLLKRGPVDDSIAFSSPRPRRQPQRQAA